VPNRHLKEQSGELAPPRPIRPEANMADGASWAAAT